MSQDAQTMALMLCLAGGVLPWLTLLIGFSLIGIMRKLINLVERRMTEWM